MTYSDTASQSGSKKQILALIYPSERVKLWTLFSGSVYSKSISFFVSGVSVDSVDLTEGTSTSLNAGEFYFDFSTKTIYVRLSDSSNPQDSFVSLTYKIGFSTDGIKYAHDITSGEEFEYLPLISGISDFPLGLDAEQLGIAIESNGSINFNEDGFWVDYFDTLVWNKKQISIYSLLENNTQQLFEGTIKEKSYSANRASFNISDNVYKLRQPITTSLFSASDGDISDDIIGKPKRTIYGKVKGLRMVSLDKVLDGYDLTGSIALVEAGSTATGVGTAFLKELSPEDEISFTLNDVTYEYRVESVESDTEAILSDESEVTVSGQSMTVRPEISYRYKNREFLIAGHKLRNPSTTISSVTQLNRINVVDPTDFLIGDTIMVGSETSIIKRVQGSLFVLRTNLPSTPAIGTTVEKSPLDTVYFDNRRYIIDRDWTLTQNNSSGAKVTLEDDAEFNATTPQRVIGSLSFTNGSRDVAGTASLFTADFKPRDWVISDDPTHQTWYEVLSVTDDTNLVLRTAYAGGNDSSPASKKKSIKYISDDSIVTCDCTGKENASGEWVKTASDIVKDLLTDASITNLDTDAFTDADNEAPFIMSLKLPLTPESTPPVVKDVVGLISQSVFGSLVQRSSFLFAYDILSAERPQNTEDSITNDDLSASPSVSTRSNIYKKIIGKYLHQDNEKTSGESSSSVEEFENDFVANMIDTEEELEKDIYLYDSNNAQTIVERYAFFHSMSQSLIKLSGGGLTLSDKQLNDKIYLKSDKVYKRFGSIDQAKVVIVNAIRQNGLKYDIDCNDLGNWFNRTAAITPNDANDFDSATEKEIILNGYIVDNDTELPDNISEDYLNTNLIG